MKKYLVLVAAFALAACSPPQPERVIRVGDSSQQQTQPPKPIINQVDDYGFVPELGCNVKWVWTNGPHPNFWLVQCPGSKTQTFYESGSKSKTYGSASIE